MAAKEYPSGAATLAAKQNIFNKLCVAYLRSNNSDRINADELRRELNIPEAIFAQALSDFLSVEDHMAVEVFENKGRTYLRLGETGRDICSDWSPKEKRRQLRAAPSVNVPIGSLMRRSA